MTYVFTRAKVRVALCQVSTLSNMIQEKKIFKGFFTIYGHGGNPGHATRTDYINF